MVKQVIEDQAITTALALTAEGMPKEQKGESVWIYLPSSATTPIASTVTMLLTQLSN